jgi:nucleoid-associated protein YgaU
MELRAKYDQAIQTANSVQMVGGAQERNGKLYFSGVVKSQEEKNRIWNALKTVPEWRTEVVADIKVVAMRATSPAPATSTIKTYTVQPGDTLSKVAKAQLGNAGDYLRIFEANRDQLSDPDTIEPGQVLRIPS